MPKVLIAEDDPGVRKLIAFTLAEAGHEVIEAEDGAAALELAFEECPEVILLDVDMPVMNGFEVLRGLRGNSSTESTPIVLLTGLDAAEGEPMAMKLGVEHYLTKPVLPDVLKSVVKVALRSSTVINATVKVGKSKLDEKLGGGIPPGSLTLVEGTSSAGKSVLCQHLIYGALNVGHRVACFTSEDSVRSLMAQMGSIGLPVSSYLRSGHLKVYPLEEPEEEEAGGVLLKALAGEMAVVPKEYQLLVVDSITSLASGSDDHTVASFFSHCKRLCANRRTVILVVHSFAVDERMLIRLRSLCDAHLKLSVENMGEKQIRVLEVCKIRSANQTTGNVVSFEVQPAFGIKVLPISKAKA